MRLFLKGRKNFKPEFSADFRFRGTVKNMILYTEDFKTFKGPGNLVLSEEDLQKFMEDKNLIYLGQPVKVRASSDFVAVANAVFYKNIPFEARPGNNYLGFLDIRFPAEDGEIDLDFIVQKVKELYPDIVTELPKKPLEELSDEPGFHGTYFVEKWKNKKIITTARGAIIIRKGYEDYPKDLQKYIDYVLGLRDADDEIIEALTEFEKPQLFVETAGAVGGAYINLFRDSYKGELYYKSDDYYLVGKKKEVPINFPWGPSDPEVKTEKKHIVITGATATKKGITIDTVYLDGRWKITVPWDYNGPNPITIDTSSELPPEITKEPVYKVPKAEQADYYQEFHYSNGVLVYYEDEGTFGYTDYESDREIKVSKDVLEAAETIEEAIELQKFLQ